MLIKRPIYNQQLKCVAFEILVANNEEMNDDLYSHFIQLINTTQVQLPLFIPYELKCFIESGTTLIQNPVILKLAAKDIDSLYPAEDIKNSLFSIALLINTPQELAWLNCAEYIGLTEELLSHAQVAKVVQYSKKQQRKVIAYGLAQPLSFHQCKSLIIDYYCGDFLFKPFKGDHLEIAANKLNVLQLITLLHQEDCDLVTISSIVKSDPLLSYQLLRLANSPIFTSAPIAAIEQAIMRLGIINLKNWIMLFSMKNISQKPIEVLDSGLIRAYMIQEIAKKNQDINSQSAYATGLLSILDSLLNIPMMELTSYISLSPDIHKALTEHTGPLGELLALISAYELGNWDYVSPGAINELELSKLYIESLAFIQQTNHRI